jgi:hypothetical protein
LGGVSSFAQELRKQAEIENQALLDAFSNMRSAAEDEKAAQEATMRAEAERRRQDQQRQVWWNFRRSELRSASCV